VPKPALGAPAAATTPALPEALPALLVPGTSTGVALALVLAGAAKLPPLFVTVCVVLSGAKLFSQALSASERLASNAPRPRLARGCIHLRIHISSTRDRSSKRAFGHIYPVWATVAAGAVRSDQTLEIASNSGAHFVTSVSGARSEPFSPLSAANLRGLCVPPPSAAEPRRSQGTCELTSLGSNALRLG
jgi:hypothetical protein